MYWKKILAISMLLSGAWATARAQAFRLPAEPAREALFGRGGQERIASLAQQTNGVIAAVGTASRGQNGGEDALLLLLREDLTPLAQREIGRDGDDGGRQLRCRPEGGYLLAGYSGEPSAPSPKKRLYRGKKDAWLLWLDEDGNTEGELILGGVADDEWVDAWPLRGGGWMLAGNSGPNAWVARLSAAGELLWEQRWQYLGQPTRVRKALLTWDERFFIVGATQAADGAHWWMARLSPAGKIIWENQYTADSGAEAYDLTAVSAHRIAVVGERASLGLRADGFIAIVDDNGRVQRSQPLGGREWDRSLAVARRADGGLLVLGESLSFQRGARRTQAWLTALDTLLQPTVEQFYGQTLDDAGYALLKTRRQTWLCGGYASQALLTSEQGWVWELGAVEKPPVAAPATAQPVLAEAPVFTHPPGRPELLRVYVPVVDQQLPGSATPLAASALSGSLAPQAALPVMAYPGWQSVSVGEREIEEAQYLQLSAYGQPQGDPTPMPRWEAGALAPQLQLAMTAAPLPFAPGSTQSVAITVANEGGLPAKDVVLAIQPPPGFEAPALFNLGDIAPGATRQLFLPITLRRPAGLDAELQLRAYDSTADYADTLAVVLASAAPAPADTTARYLTAVWVSPNPDNYEARDIVWNSEEITLQLKVVSDKPVTGARYCFSVNGVPCATGAKMDEVSLLGRTVSHRLRLSEGVNEVVATVSSQVGECHTPPLRIVYAPTRPNLHVVSIGVPSFDLRFTATDARDFAGALTRYAYRNEAFQHIFVDTLVSPETTTKTAILKTLRRLQYRHDDRQISENDLLVVFISSHGVNGARGEFRIAASDYDGPFLQETSLDFAGEIAAYLADIPCRKVFFIDACHSGTAGHDPEGADEPAGSRQLVEWAVSNNLDLSLLLSCQASEYSYEDQAWKNGAFTEALLQALELFYQQSPQVDANADRRLDLAEWFAYIQGRTPQLVGEKRPKPRTSQNPLLKLSRPGEAPVLFALPQR
jgi:hypothetical protein